MYLACNLGVDPGWMPRSPGAAFVLCSLMNQQSPTYRYARARARRMTRTALTARAKGPSFGYCIYLCSFFVVFVPHKFAVHPFPTAFARPALHNPYCVCAALHKFSPVHPT